MQYKNIYYFATYTIMRNSDGYVKEKP